MNYFRYLKYSVRLLVLTILMGLVACANVQMPTPVASVTNHEKIRAANMTPTQVGEFKLAPGKPASMDTTISGLRGSSVVPSAGSFSKQLREELIVELKGAGLLDPASTLKIEGELTDSMVDAAIGTGKGRLAARFKVTRYGHLVFDKELSVEASWESSFMGAVAVPTAINQYGALYKALVGRLLDDSEFMKVIIKN